MRVLAATLVVLLLVTGLAPAAHACVECVALGLASFAVFNQLVWALSAPRVVYAPPAYYHAPPAYYHAPPAYYYYPPYSYAPPVYYSPPPVSTHPPVHYAPPASAPPSGAAPGTVAVRSDPVPGPSARPGVVQYPHGRYELRGDGVRERYVWVWIPSAPAPTAVAPVPGAPDLASR
jgi:hypothetical protein